MAQTEEVNPKQYEKLVDDLGIDKILLVQNSGIPISAYGVDVNNNEEVDKFIIVSALIKAVRGFFQLSDCARVDTLRIDDLNDKNGRLILEIGSEWEDYQENGEKKWRIYDNFSFLIRDPPKGEIQAQILRKAFKDIVKKFNQEHPEMLGDAGGIDIDKYSDYLPQFIRESLDDADERDLKDNLEQDDSLIKLFDYRKTGDDLEIRSNKGQKLSLVENSLIDLETKKSMDLHSGKLLAPYEVQDDKHPDGFSYFEDMETSDYCPCTLFENLPMYLHELAPTYHLLASEVYMSQYKDCPEADELNLASSIGIIDGLLRFIITIKKEDDQTYVGSMMRIARKENDNLIAKVTNSVQRTIRKTIGKDLVRQIYTKNSFKE